MTDWLPFLLLGGVVFLGAATQRISGMGFALVASPFLVALLGPFQGVVLVNLLGGLTAFTLFLTGLRRVEYRKVALLLIPAIIATVPGALVARLVPFAILSTVIGGLVVLALLGSLFAKESVWVMGRGGAVVAGVVSGFMSITAGVGGPAIASYAVATHWPHRAFAASVQLYFFVLAVVSLTFKGAFPELIWQAWVVCGVFLGVGILVGHFLAKAIRPKAARILVIVIAFIGAIVIVVKGVVELIGS